MLSLPLRRKAKESTGHRVLFVHEAGPAERGGLVTYLDLITHIDGEPLVRGGQAGDARSSESATWW
jgi:C-terminal processing protease CtpA/Prc